MPIKSLVYDGGGRGNKAKVEDGGLLVSLIPHPALLPQKSRIFRQHLTVDGTSTGSSDFLVDGTTPVDFYVEASQTNDTYITNLSFVLAYPSSSAIFAEFADDAAALTNGCKLSYGVFAQADIDIHDAIKVNGELMRLDEGHNLSETRNFLAVNDYGFVSNVNLAAYVPQYGVKLDKGTTQRLKFTVQDDLTASNATLFNCIAYGFERFE